MIVNEGAFVDVGRETLEGDQLITEGILAELFEENGIVGSDLSESDYMELMSEASMLLSEKNIIRLDKITKRGIAERRAVVVLARENNDPLYKKLVIVYKMRRKLLDALTRKYATKAKSRVRKNMNARPVQNMLSKLPGIKGHKSTAFKSNDLPSTRR